MARYCPIVKGKVVYLTCKECELSKSECLERTAEQRTNKESAEKENK